MTQTHTNSRDQIMRITYYHRSDTCQGGRKNTERCLAGIELTKSARIGFRYDIVRAENDRRPKWIRPVSFSKHGEVDAILVDHVNLLDIVEINVTQTVPQGYQSENVRFTDQPLDVVDKVEQNSSLMDKLITEDGSLLFGNRGKAVNIEHVEQLNYSLILVKPTNVEVSSNTSRSEKIRLLFLTGFPMI